MSELDRILKELEGNKKRIAEMEKKGLENPEQFLKEMGIDPNNIDKEQLKKTGADLAELVKPLENIFNGKNFKDLNNFHSNKIKNNPETKEEDKKKLEELGKVAFGKDFKNKTQTCFIGIDCDKQIIDAHSIQENGELSLIAENKKVFYFTQNQKENKKEITEIEIKNASVFKGFCHKHDQLFEPIDKNKTESIEQKLFLYSLRSFAFSYHNVKSFQSYYSNFANNSISSVAPIADTLKDNDTINQLMNAFGLGDLIKQLNNEKILEITEEQKQTLEITRFEKQRKLLIEYVNQNDYSQLDYMVYETNHLCPIACASWMILHVQFGNGFLITSNGKTPYYGFPIIISVIPSNNKTKVILSRFKVDNGSELIFNQWINIISDTEKFEKELSKLIIENVENFYLSPVFWGKLSEQEKKIIFNAMTVNKKQFPEGRTEFEIINFFDQKYQIKNSENVIF